jgi:hypothetical protein
MEPPLLLTTTTEVPLLQVKLGVLCWWQSEAQQQQQQQQLLPAVCARVRSIESPAASSSRTPHPSSRTPAT